MLAPNVMRIMRTRMSITGIERISVPTPHIDNMGESKSRLGGWFDGGCFVGC